MQLFKSDPLKTCKIEMEKLRMAEIKLEEILDKKHALYQLANRLNWEHLIKELGPFYFEGPGRPEIPIRVIAGLH